MEPLDQVRTRAPKIHCLTNPVTMRDVANVLLTAGGSAIMAQSPKEAAEITAICHGTLLNTGVPDEEKFLACMLAGKKANELGHPVVLDPVGIGGSTFRREHLDELLQQVQISVIRCNQEEASVLLGHSLSQSGGVESSLHLSSAVQETLSKQLARKYSAVAYISGKQDMVSDGRSTRVLVGGDDRMRRLTGSGCMLSSLIALFAAAGVPALEAAAFAGQLWKESAALAGKKTDMALGGMGTYYVCLLDALDHLCHPAGQSERIN
jgi:hydroxyethylthiazole kinase